MSELSYAGNFRAEKFIQTVTRAFYTDSVVIVVDALLREKYIREEELGPRLRMSQKQAREVVAMLVDNEMLVKFEEVPLNQVDPSLVSSKQIAKFYYIDYQAFVNIIRFRVYFMLKSVESEEKSELDEIFYECPSCQARYSSLQAMKQRSSDYKFLCTHCCPDFDLSKAISHPSYKLKEIDNRGKISNIQKLERKMREQLSRSSDHDGILEMLEDLKDAALTRNKPSYNIQKGIRSSRIRDHEVNDDILLIERNGSKVETVNIQEKHFNLLSTRLDGTRSDKVMIAHGQDNQDSSGDGQDRNISSDVSDEMNFQKIKRARQSEIPDFLKESGVKGSTAIMKQVEALHMQRGIAMVSHSTIDEDKRNMQATSSFIHKREVMLSTSTPLRTAEESLENGTSEDNQDADDIDWEDEDDN